NISTWLENTEITITTNGYEESSVIGGSGGHGIDGGAWKEMRSKWVVKMSASRAAVELFPATPKPGRLPICDTKVVAKAFLTAGNRTPRRVIRFSTVAQTQVISF
ncbi:hypothetical protein L195_g055592, partial [Trifolium pratense]